MNKSKHVRSNFVYRVLIFILFFFYFSLCGFSQNQTIKYYNDQWLQCPKSEASYYRIIQNNSGRKEPKLVKDFFINGKLQWEGHLSSLEPDINEGLCIWYHQNGIIAQKAFYIKGNVDGEFIAFYKNGNLNAKSFYKNGLTEGEAISFYPNGKTLISKSNHKNGKRFGTETHYYPNGQIRLILHYQNDTLQGDRISYTEDGKLESKGFYKNGKQQGEDLSYYNSGQLNSKRYYDTGVLVGEELSYFDNGSLKGKGFYNYGKKEGDFFQYFKSGAVQQISSYDKDTLKYEITYFITGQIKKEFIRKSKNNYTSKEWDNTGILIRNNIILNGEEINYIDNNSRNQYRYKISDSLGIHPSKDNKLCLYGFKDYRNKWVVKPQFTNVTEYGQYYIVSQNEKYGVMDYSGHIIIPVGYDNIKFTVADKSKMNYSQDSRERFYLPEAGFFKVNKNNVWGIINRKNQLILPIKYDEPKDLVNGMILFMSGKLYGFTDTLGNVVLPKFKCLLDFSTRGYAVFSNTIPKENVTGKYGAVNTKGEIIVPCNYDIVMDANNGYRVHDLIWVANNKKYGLYTIEGEKLLDEEFTGYRYFREDEYHNYPHFSYNDSIAAIYKNGKCGILRYDGTIILPCEYDSIKWINTNYPNANGVAIGFIKSDNQWAAINKKGETLTPWYDEMEAIIEFVGYENEAHFYTINFLAKRNNKYGIVNDADSILVPFEFDLAFIIKERDGAVFLIKNHQLNVFKNKQLIKPEDIANYLNFENVLLKFWISDGNADENFTCGVVNYLGQILLMPYYLVTIYNDQYIVWVNKSGESGILNQKGEIILKEGDYESIENITGDLATIIKPNGKIGILDLKNKKFIVDTVFEAIADYDFNYNVCWVKPDLRDIEDSWEGDYGYDLKKGGWGLIGQNKKYILQPEYDYPGVFTDSLALIYKDDRMGLVRVDGKFMLPCIYDDIREQKSGLYFIKKEKWGIADKHGKILIEPIWDDMGDLIGGQAPFWKDGNLGLVDSTGKINIAAQKDGFAKSQFRVETLFNYYDNIGDSGYRKVDISELCEGHEMVKEYFTSKPNIQIETMTNNLMISLLMNNYAYGNHLQDEGTPYYGPSINYVYPKAYRETFFYQTGSGTDYDYLYELIDITAKTVSIAETFNESNWQSHGGGWGHTSISYLNFAITSSHQLVRVETKNLFDSTKNYEEKLNELLYKQAISLQDVDLPCTDMNKYFEMVGNSFAITDSGIDFYLDLNYGAVISYTSLDDAVILSIPFSDLKGIIDENGVLGDFVR